MAQILFAIFALASCGGALAVVLSQNVVRMAFWLIISLGSVAGLFFMLNADFVGAVQLLIYVGGTVVLLIFGVMLTSSEPFVAIKQSPAEVAQGALVGVAFLAMALSTVLAVDWEANQQSLSPGHGHATAQASGYNRQSEGNSARSIGTALLGVRFDQDLGAGDHLHDAHGHHREVSTGYLLPFEIVSVHLLVVLIGAAYLARAKRQRPANAA